MRNARVILAAALLATAFVLPAAAADSVKIGVIYPLTGNAAPAGNSAKDAVELGVEIVNGMHPELTGLPLAATADLPNLGGAKIELISADHQGNPSVGQNQTLRLISQGDETRLASPCNIFGRLVGDPKSLAKVKAGARVKVSLAG